MTTSDRGRTGALLGAYLLAARAIPLAAPFVLRRRLARGKELPGRWREKLGEPGLARPDAPVVWLHAVGLGETLALRGLIHAMAEAAPATEFLVTSTTRGSAEVFGANLPARTRHQFLPLDAPGYLARFLGHWRPSLSVWAEQDLWPGAVFAASARGIPLALVNARMNAEAYGRRRRWRGIYADLLSRFRLVAAQDPDTARHLEALGAAGVRVMGSLKASAPPLGADAARLDDARRSLGGRRAVLLASSHPEDEAIILEAVVNMATRPLLIVAPRDPSRGAEVSAEAAAHGLTATRRSEGQGPAGDVWVADTFGELGIWYRLCPVTVIGGTFGQTEGHNPWEPAALGSAILHGHRVANFAADFAALRRREAALAASPGSLAEALATDHADMAMRARRVSEEARSALAPLATELLALGGLA